MRKNPEIPIKHEAPQQTFPESDLLLFVEKIYAKAPAMSGLPNLRERYVKAIADRDINVLKDLALALLARLNYDRKYQGCKEDTDDYNREKGYSWKDFNSAHEQLQAWVEMNK
ncbi:MAG: hypothetical protein WC842_04280 [Candidatus Paceibacterota bacterium]|jgi:hypothetical protein